MQAASLTRVTLARTLASPIGVLLACAALAAWPVLVALAPLAIRSASSHPRWWSYEFAFMSAAAGTALAVAERKRLDRWIRVSRPAIHPAVDALVVGACGLLFATFSLAAAAFIGAGPTLAAGHLLPLLGVAAAWGSLALRVTPAPEAAGWTAAAGAFLTPALFPEFGAVARPAAAVAALLLGAWILDHPPRGLR